MGARGISIPATMNLPAANATVRGAVIDLTADARFLGGCEGTIVAPSLTTSELPDGSTVSYDFEGSPDQDFANVRPFNVIEPNQPNNAPIISPALVQTGAGGAGASAATVTVPIPRGLIRFIRMVAVNSGAGNPSAKTVTATADF